MAMPYVSVYCIILALLYVCTHLVQEAGQRQEYEGGSNGWYFNACTVMWCVVCMGKLSS